MRFRFVVRISESAHVFFMILVMLFTLVVLVMVVMIVMLLLFVEDGPIRNFIILCVETGEAVANVKTTNISFEGCAEALSLIAGLLLSG